MEIFIVAGRQRGNRWPYLRSDNAGVSVGKSRSLHSLIVDA
jgi:hypothetical protein